MGGIGLVILSRPYLIFGIAEKFCHTEGGLRNMTYQDLLLLRKMKLEGQKLHSQLSDARQRAFRLSTSHFDGMPRRSSHDHDRVEDTVTRLADLEEAVHAHDLRRLRLEKAVYQFIVSLPDTRIRLAVELHYIDLVPWESVAQIVDRNNVDYGIKKAVHRCLRDTLDPE